MSAPHLTPIPGPAADLAACLAARQGARLKGAVACGTDPGPSEIWRLAPVEVA